MAAGAGASRPWLDRYPPGIPADIEPDELGTLVELIDRAVATYSDRPAFISFGKSVTYRTLGTQSDAVAAWLAASGFGKGDRVAIMLPNVAAYPYALAGVLKSGCTVVNVNPLYTPREFTNQLRDSGARALFVLENFASTVQAALPDLPALERVIVVGPGDGLGLKGKVIDLVSRHVKKAVPAYSLPAQKQIRFLAALSEGRALKRPNPGITQGDLAFLQYTGGTTGVAKGAMLTHRNMVSNVEQSRLWFQTSGDDDRMRVMVTALPLYHIFALTGCFFLFTAVGGCCLLIANPRDADAFVKTLASTRFTHFAGVNTLFNLLVNHPKIGTVDFAEGREGFHVGGGMAVQKVVAAKWKAATGKVILEGYGLSETAPVVSVNPIGLTEWSGTIGFPVPSTHVSIRDADGTVLSPGEPGELCVSGPQVMSGYWQRAEETARAFHPDGFFRTGDIATMTPEGEIRIVDRMKDMILVSGFNVYPNEVEDVIASHPGVLECAVVGEDNPECGEIVVAHVVKKDPGLTTEVLRAHARGLLTAYKVPRKVVFRDTLPKTNVGKVLRRALRDEQPPAT